MLVRDMQFVDMMTRWDEHYETTVRVWMFLNTVDYNYIKQMINTLDRFTIQCDTN